MYRNLNLFLGKCTKTVATRPAPFGSDMHQIICRLGLTGGAYSAPPDPLAGLGAGAPGKGKEGRQGEKERGKGRERRGEEGRESRNAKIQSWQA